MKPPRRPDQARRQHRKQLQYKDPFETRTPYMLEQGTTSDVIEDPVNQLVGTGLTYVDIPDEQTTSVQPPTTSLPWCAGSKNGIRQSRWFNISFLSFKHLLQLRQDSEVLCFLLLPCTYILFCFSKTSLSISRHKSTPIVKGYHYTGRIQHHLRHEQDTALAAAHRACPPQFARSSPIWRLYLFQDVAGSSSVRQHQPRCYTVGHSWRRC
jgi:hypothetical protein